MRSTTSVGSVIRAVFPIGTVSSPQLTDATFKNTHGTMPQWPTDVFALAGTLVEYSGIYHRLKPAKLSSYDETALARVKQQLQVVKSAPIENIADHAITALDIIKAGTQMWCEFGQLWRTNSDYFPLIAPLWNLLVENERESVRLTNVPNMDDIAWASAALALLVISDEACEGLGYLDGSWIERPFRDAANEENIEGAYPGHIQPPFQDGSMTLLADESVVCVMPKSRTATIGCTMRTLSHNLALLPPPHKASSFWLRSPQNLEKNTKPLNLLLVPYPYEIDAQDFKGTDSEQSYPPQFDRWGEFDLHQNWLKEGSGRDKIDRKITDLLDLAKKQGTLIEGIVLPEYALDWKTYACIVEELRDKKYESVRFLVSGCSEEYSKNKPGNFVLTTVFYEAAGVERRVAITTSRGKHHRWRLNGSQVATYCLDGVLDANTFWWENIPLTDRKINNIVFREGSVFATLICEDLARSEPVHSVLQSIGPNLVFVLLMDGPQLETRWAARNATGLTEDPGSSVLTFTCRALLTRQAQRGYGHKPNYTVALWKDDTQNIQLIECPPENDAAIVTLSAARAKETTLDGRANSNAWAWRMSGYQLISAGEGNKKG